MTGASCAYHLTELGVKNIVLIDARGLCEGSAKPRWTYLLFYSFHLSRCNRQKRWTLVVISVLCVNTNTRAYVVASGGTLPASKPVSVIDKYGIENLKKEVAFQYHNTRLMMKFIEGTPGIANPV